MEVYGCTNYLYPYYQTKARPYEPKRVNRLTIVNNTPYPAIIEVNYTNDTMEEETIAANRVYDRTILAGSDYPIRKSFSIRLAGRTCTFDNALVYESLGWEEAEQKPFTISQLCPIPIR